MRGRCRAAGARGQRESATRRRTDRWPGMTPHAARGRARLRDTRTTHAPSMAREVLDSRFLPSDSQFTLMILCRRSSAGGGKACPERAHEGTRVGKGANPKN